MTLRESIIQVIRGGHADATLQLSLSTPGFNVVQPNRVIEHLSSDGITLGLIPNPYLLARLNGEDLNESLRQDPEKGEHLAASFENECQKLIQTTLENGADGIFYLLDGARGACSTPMEYGGYHLERDRAILESVSAATINVVFVVGNDDLYIDFVSDLPAQLFAWDSLASTFTPDYVRSLRVGALVTNHPDADVQLSIDVNALITQIESSISIGSGQTKEAKIELPV